MMMDDAEQTEVHGETDERENPGEQRYHGPCEAADHAVSDGEQEGDEGDAGGDWVQYHDAGEAVRGAGCDCGDGGLV